MTTKTFFTKVVGVTHKNDNGTNRQDVILGVAKPSCKVELVPEPDNPVDSNAVAVWISGRTFIFFKFRAQIGYLDSRLAGELTRHAEQGGRYEARITEVTGKGKSTRGVNLQISKW